MKWNIFKFMAENKEANEELGEWMNEQLEKVKKKRTERVFVPFSIKDGRKDFITTQRIIKKLLYIVCF